ncbi:MAG: hypothetical protein IH934_04215 [Nanoarchaeota archaeon]|nr:hypothetical protein [Nanoarchaeota archaeon]
MEEGNQDGEDLGKRIQSLIETMKRENKNFDEQGRNLTTELVNQFYAELLSLGYEKADPITPGYVHCVRKSGVEILIITGIEKGVRVDVSIPEVNEYNDSFFKPQETGRGIGKPSLHYLKWAQSYQFSEILEKSTISTIDSIARHGIEIRLQVNPPTIYQIPFPLQ